MHLTLLVPELIWPEPADQFTLGKLTTPGFQWLMARARAERQPRCPFETVLARQFGHAAAPFGALRLLGEGHEPARSGHWLCADPVHLRFHHERIILADAGAFDLDDDEARHVVAALNAEFADIGEFHMASARRWYLRLHVAVDHPVAPLSAIAGRAIDGELSGNALPLTRWLNEVQMFLHGHPVNERRQGEGKPAINSLWLWGGGAIDPSANAAPSCSAVFADNPLAAGLARAAAIPLHARPETLADLLAQSSGQPLVVLDDLLSRVLYEDGQGWRTAFEKLESDWFVLLQKALGKQVDRVSLIAPTVYGELHYTLSAGDRWKFWKSSPPVQDIAQALAGNAAP